MYSAQHAVGKSILVPFGAAQTQGAQHLEGRFHCQYSSPHPVLLKQ